MVRLGSPCDTDAMSIGAQAGEPFEAIADGAALSLVGEITVEIYDPSTGAVIVAPSAAGIAEPRPGTYRVELTCPSAGSYSIRWQSPSGEAAEENLLVTDTAVIVPHE
jgi:hypothetical protein